MWEFGRPRYEPISKKNHQPTTSIANFFVPIPRNTIKTRLKLDKLNDADANDVHGVIYIHIKSQQQ